MRSKKSAGNVAAQKGYNAKPSSKTELPNIMLQRIASLSNKLTPQQVIECKDFVALNCVVTFTDCQFIDNQTVYLIPHRKVRLPAKSISFLPSEIYYLQNSSPEVLKAVCLAKRTVEGRVLYTESYTFPANTPLNPPLTD